MNCKIIAFEGADMCGKTTQAKILCEKLNSAGYRALYVKFPFAEHKHLYKMIYDGIFNEFVFRHPMLFQSLNFFDKALFSVTKLNAYKRHYDFIIFDRWKLSSLVYGVTAGAPKLIMQGLDKLLPTPDLTLIMFGKRNDRPLNNVDIIDNNLNFQNRLGTNYNSYADMRSTSFICNGDRSINDINSNIIDVMIYRNMI